MLQLLTETNPQEASEFCEAYLWNAKILLFLSGYVMFVTLYLFCQNKYDRFLLPRLQRAICPKAISFVNIFVGAVIVSCLLFVYHTRNFRSVKWYCLSAENINDLELLFVTRPLEASLYHPALRLAFASRINHLLQSEITSVQNQVGRTTIDSCKFVSPTIVLIIGESYNHKHSSLYGYSKPTTPCQQRRAEAHELISFSDVITSSNSTAYVFKNSFSFHSAEQDGSWATQTMFPAVFRKSGYQVTFLSNQFVTNDKTMNALNTEAFIIDPKLGKVLFDIRNQQKYPYDEGLLDDYSHVSRQIWRSPHNLIIFHLYGQHVSYHKRYPSEWKRFEWTDYQRPDLSEANKRILADYDNATLYNDHIVDRIISYFEEQDAILIYMPDHGEEVFDGLNIFGRYHSRKLNTVILNNEYRIPFWIWTSNAYRENHSKIVREIQNSTNNPYMSDDIGHTLCYLAGIYCEAYDESRALISPRFNPRRKRLINGNNTVGKKEYFDFDKLLHEVK